MAAPMLQMMSDVRMFGLLGIGSQQILEWFLQSSACFQDRLVDHRPITNYNFDGYKSTITFSTIVLLTNCKIALQVYVSLKSCVNYQRL